MVEVGVPKVSFASRDVPLEREAANTERPPVTTEVALPLSDNSNSTLVSSPERVVPHSDRPFLNRQRSKSSAVESPTKFKTSRDWNFPPVRDYQFPPVGFATDSGSVPPTGSPPMRVHSRLSSTHASASTVSSSAASSRSSHQFTQSLDASGMPHRLPSPVGLLPIPPPMLRSRSAAPFGDKIPEGFGPTSNGPAGTPKSVAKKPSMTRMASLAVMETVQTPSRPFGRHNGARSGSLGDADPPLPGLKDVLKVANFRPFNISIH